MHYQKISNFVHTQAIELKITLLSQNMELESSLSCHNQLYHCGFNSYKLVDLEKLPAWRQQHYYLNKHVSFW